LVLFLAGNKLAGGRVGYEREAKKIVMTNIEHIGIAVKDLTAAIPVYEAMLNSLCYKTEVVAREKVNTAFFRVGSSKIELLESSAADGVIANFIAKKGEGIHHIAFEVDDILAEMERLKKAGFRLLHEQPVPGADNKMVCFLHPKSAHGVLVELCMERK
jgi:methylmalonyl-CoA/ethylmalonyl-CoA epimerase